MLVYRLAGFGQNPLFIPPILEGAAGMIMVRDAEESALALPRTYGIKDPFDPLTPYRYHWHMHGSDKMIMHYKAK